MLDLSDQAGCAQKLSDVSLLFHALQLSLSKRILNSPSTVEWKNISVLILMKFVNSSCVVRALLKSRMHMANIFMQ